MAPLEIALIKQSRSPGERQAFLKKHGFLMDLERLNSISDGDVGLLSAEADGSRESISKLKDFYLKRLAERGPEAVHRLHGIALKHGKTFSADDTPAQGRGRARNKAVHRSLTAPPSAMNVEDLEIMSGCGEEGPQTVLGVQCETQSGVPIEPASVAVWLNVKLTKLRSVIEARLQAQETRVSVMRHLTQLRYHIDAAVKWTYGSEQIGAMSERTVDQVRQLTVVARMLPPAMYVFTRRVENTINQKERELKKYLTAAAAGFSDPRTPGANTLRAMATADLSTPMQTDSSPTSPRNIMEFDASSDATTIDSPTPTHAYPTMLSQEHVGPQGAGLRAWFYYQCLSEKISRKDLSVGPGRVPLVADLYCKVQKEQVPTQQWLHWIKTQLDSELPGGADNHHVATV